MTDFKRARSCEQKEQRMAQIKAAAEALYEQMPYQEITLTAIAKELGWSRANLYKYVATKEEVFLGIVADRRDAYLEALLTALPVGCGFDNATIASVWSGLAAAHREFFRMNGMLLTVIETNVSVEKLVEFKRGYYSYLRQMQEQLSGVLGVREELVEELGITVINQATGLAGSCLNNPLVAEAVSSLGISPRLIDFQAQMRDFIAMVVPWYQAK